MTTPRIIIGALSGRNMLPRRQQCRATWMADAKALGVDAVFLMAGNTGPHRLGDVLVLPGHDAYAFLPQRTYWFCRWALERDDWDWLFKCDDDTYVCVERLIEEVRQYDDINGLWRIAGGKCEYIGAEWKPGVGYASGGAGYLINRRAAQTIVDHMLSPIGSEDLMVGDVLKEHGFIMKISGLFIPYGNEELRPKEQNCKITAHAIGPELFAKCHLEVGLKK